MLLINQAWQTLSSIKFKVEDLLSEKSQNLSLNSIPRDWVNHNLLDYRSKECIEDYAKRCELYPPEAYVFSKYRPFIANARVLDIGVGGGRTTGHLVHHCLSYRGVDYSPEMIEACRNRFPDLGLDVFGVRDVRNLSEEPSEGYDFVLFAYNGIDSVEHDDRALALAEIHRVLHINGYFFFSTHSLHAFPFSDTYVQEKNKHVNFPELRDRGWYYLIDYADTGVTYYIYPAVQQRYLEQSGFTVIEALNMNGKPFDFANPPADWMVHFLCRRSQ